VTPGRTDSAAIREAPEPSAVSGSVLVQSIAVGFCRTDISLIDGRYGVKPDGADYLILGHEVAGRVAEAPAAGGLRQGDLVAGIVRHPDPAPCRMCACDRYDLCESDAIVERGIARMDGYGSEWFRSAPEFLVKLDDRLGVSGVLVEPAAVMAKAWEQLNSVAAPRNVAVIGAGPVGMLAALLCTRQGVAVHMVDQVDRGIKPELAKRIGVRYGTEIDRAVKDADAVLECTGSSSAVRDVFTYGNSHQVICLTGISSGSRRIDFAVNGGVGSIILDNRTLLATVSARRSHYLAAASALASSDLSVVAEIITGRWPVADWRKALESGPDRLKSVLEFTT
jgi:threonine dehydrogenase-like Zn-dependent dehydrogenase